MNVNNFSFEEDAFLRLSRITTTHRALFLRYAYQQGHAATSRKVAGSFPDEVTEFFNWPNPSSRTMPLGSTKPLTEMSTRNLSGGKERPACKADNLSANCEPIVWKMWEPRRLTTLWASTTCYGIALPLRIPEYNLGVPENFWRPTNSICACEFCASRLRLTASMKTPVNVFLGGVFCMYTHLYR
jgi:hypothetical protein